MSTIKKGLIILYVLAGVTLVLVISMVTIKSKDGQGVNITLAWPWHFPIGTAMTFVIGYLIGNKTEKEKIANTEY